jgi:thioredoxin 1
MLEINTGINLVKFGAAWCGPCKVISSTINRIEPEFPLVKFSDIDVDDNPDLAKDYKIRSVPTVILFNKGEELTRLVGSVKIDALRKVLRDVTNDVAA